MYFRDTGFVPNDPSNRGYLKNPNGSLPFPKPSNMPIGFWDGGEIALQTFPASSPYWREATYQTPIFDLRPDLRSMTGGEQEGVPIWKYSGSGRGGRLHLMIDNIDGGATVGLNVECSEIVSPNRPSIMRQVTDCVDISDQFVVDTRSATYVSFEPTGEFPIRFWQVKLDFRWSETLAQVPKFSIFASYY